MPGNPMRSVRISDELWERAQLVAETRGDKLADIMRRALIDYVERFGEPLDQEQDNDR